MSSRKAAAVIATAIKQAQAGVDYSPRTGATCPCCGAENLRVRNTLPWSGAMRVRFHLCANPRCVLAQLKQSIKSVEKDSEPEQRPVVTACAQV